MHRPSLAAQLPLAMLLATVLVASPGCGSVLSQISYMLYGNKVPARFEGLEGKRVAVVCLDADSLKGPGSEADAIAKSVSTHLGFHVADVEIVRGSEIADWIDNHDQDVADYRDIGRGVKADMVVGIDLDSFSIHEGQTLLKGRARVGTKVYDMSRNGEVVFENPPRDVNWPESGAHHVTENESNFRTIFIHTLAQKIAKDFYAYEKVEDYGLDAAYQGD
jgi:hypothetical protein